MSRSNFSVEHVRLTALKPFDEFIAAFEGQLGRFEEGIYKELEDGVDPAAVRDRLEGLVGPSGFMLFRTSDHGRLLGIVGEPRKAVQYLVGNPLFAIEMTRHAIGAGLYAPLRVLIHEVEPGETCVEYDLPSSLFGQFQDDGVSRVAAMLDQKLEDLVTTAAA
jgi:uncharacterized protein (DUF302 family)